MAAVTENVYANWSPSPAPDGRQIAFVSDRSGEPAVWIHARRTQQSTRLAGGLHRVVTVSWSPDGAWLACHTAAAGASRTEIWVVRPDGSDLHLVAGAGPGSATLGAGAWQGWTADGRLMVTEAVGQESTALLVDPVSGARKVLAAGPLVVLLDVAVGADRALLRLGPRGYHRLAVVGLDGSGERPVITGTGPGSTGRGCLSTAGNMVFACSDVGRELAALVAVDLDGEQPPRVLAERVLAELGRAELENVVPSPDGSKLVLLWNVHGGSSAVSVLHPSTGGEDEIGLPRDVVDGCRFDPDGTALLITAEDWADPRGVWALDLVSGQAEPISSRAAGSTQVRAGDLPRPQLHTYPSPDGTGLTGWLYRPNRPGPWPTMISLHGGPEAQERPVYNSLFRAMVATGIAVFAPNVRGSSGFGRSFGTADDRDRRFGAIEDVAATVTHLVDTGLADADRVGCMGRSYGGYLTLAALVWYPELFAVGIDVCGMADFETFYRYTEPRIAVDAVAKYGDPQTDQALLRDLSPIHRIDNLTAPLLVVHGTDDTNVPVEESEQVVAALVAREVEHRYLLFPGEGHELLRTANRVAFVRAAVDWAGRYLGVPAPS